MSVPYFFSGFTEAVDFVMCAPGLACLFSLCPNVGWVSRYLCAPSTNRVLAHRASNEYLPAKTVYDPRQAVQQLSVGVGEWMVEVVEVWRCPVTPYPFGVGKGIGKSLAICSRRPKPTRWLD